MPPTIGTGGHGGYKNNMRGSSIVIAKVKGTAAVVQWFAAAEAALTAHSDRLNRLNVFPVADSDTGANMLGAITACREAAEQHGGDDLGALLAHAGAEAMAEAHGNSGTLMAVLVSGFAEPLHGSRRLTVVGLARGLERASLRAWSALSHPVDGTMLSVLDAVRDHAQHCAAEAEEPDSRAALEDAMPPLVSTARVALERTETQLEPLTRARVVDAGGLGLLMVFEALRATLHGDEFQDAVCEGLSGWSRTDPETDEAPAVCEHSTVVEVMCTVHLDPLGAASLRHQLADMGESVIVTPIGPVNPPPQGAVRTDIDHTGAYRWRIHVHTEDEEATWAVLRAAGEIEKSTSTPVTASVVDADS